MALYALADGLRPYRPRATSQPSPKYSAMLTRAKQRTFRPIFDRRKRRANVRNLREHYRLSVTDGGRARR